MIIECRESLSKALEYCLSNELSLSISKAKNGYQVCNGLISVHINQQKVLEIYEHTNSIPPFIKKQKTKETVNKQLSFADLTRTNGTLNRSIKSLRKTDILVKKVLRENELDEARKFLSEIMTCLFLIKDQVTFFNKHLKSMPFHQTYCQLCWRMVNALEFRLYSEKENHSTHFCVNHHPLINKKNYYRDRRKLKLLQRKYGQLEQNDDLEPHEIAKGETIFHKSYLKEVSQHLYGEIISNEIFEKYESTFSELDVVRVVFNVTSKRTKYLSKAIEHFNLQTSTSWKAFFLDIIEAMSDGAVVSNLNDPTEVERYQNLDSHPALKSKKAEVIYGEEDSFKLITKEIFDNENLFNMKRLIKIIARFETYHLMQSIPQPRGPKKGCVNKKVDLRVKIRLGLNDGLSQTKIAQILKISRQRISVLVKELNGE